MAVLIDRWEAEPDKRNGKRWCVRYRDDQNKSRRKTFEKKIDGERFLKQVEHDLMVGTFRDPRSGNMTFEEYATTWLASNHRIRSTTKELNQSWLKNHLFPAFGNIPLNRLTIEHGRKYLSDDSRSPSLHEKTMTKCRQILNDAVTEGLIASNPFATLKLPKAQVKEAQILTLSELEAVIELIDPHFKTLVGLTGYTGIREGELFGLHPNNVDLDKGVIHVVEQLYPNGVRGEPKTKASKRKVTIPNFLIGDLEEQLYLRSSEEFVFTSKKGSYIQKNNFIKRYWKPAINQIREGFRFHDLRHTSVSLAIDMGANLKAVSVRAGHSSVKTTLDVYGHLMPSADADLADTLDRYRSEKLEEGPKLIALEGA